MIFTVINLNLVIYLLQISNIQYLTTATNILRQEDVAAVKNERPWVTGQGQPDFWYLYKTIVSLDFLASIMIFALIVTKNELFQMFPI